jgi:hypothetical protein
MKSSEIDLAHMKNGASSLADEYQGWTARRPAAFPEFCIFDRFPRAPPRGPRSRARVEPSRKSSIFEIIVNVSRAPPRLKNRLKMMYFPGRKMDLGFLYF